MEDCLFKAKWGMKEHVGLLTHEGLPVPLEKTDPRIIVQNEKKPLHLLPAEDDRPGRPI